MGGGGGSTSPNGCRAREKKSPNRTETVGHMEKKSLKGRGLTCYRLRLAHCKQRVEAVGRHWGSKEGLKGLGKGGR